MLSIEDLRPGIVGPGTLPSHTVTDSSVRWNGSEYFDFSAEAVRTGRSLHSRVEPRVAHPGTAGTAWVKQGAS